jgi:hypothetical protein
VKKVPLLVPPVDGSWLAQCEHNPLAVLAGFHKAAKKAGWKKDDIAAVVSIATMRKDFQHLVDVIIAHCD